MTPTPVRLQLRRSKGWNLQALSQATNGLPAVVVSRPGKWGNPFKVGDRDPELGIKLDRERAVLLFRREMADEMKCPECRGRGWNVGECHPQETCGACDGAGKVPHKPSPLAAEAVAQLRGKNLACWCPLPKAGEADVCHAAILLSVANGGNDAAEA